MQNRAIKSEKKWYQFSDGWFTYYVNTLTGEKKFELEDGDIEVNACDYLDDFCREDELAVR